MSDNDDIEKLLREIDGVAGTSSGAATPVPRPESQPDTTTSREARQGAAIVVAAVIGVIGLLLGWLPGVPGIWLGLGGFLGAYIAFTIGRRLG